jgi:hypothetical protein
VNSELVVSSTSVSLKWGEQLRKHRNTAAHATGEKISREDSTDLLEFVAAICDYIFVLTARFDAFMARKNEVVTTSLTAVAVAGPVLAAGTTDSDA